MFDSNVPKYFHHNERPEFEAFVDSFEGSYFVLETGGSVGAANLIVPETQFRWLAGEALAGRYVHVSAL